MRLPSLIYILSEAKQAVIRFPLVLISIATAGICAVILIGHEHEPGRLVPLMMVAQLGLPLLLALTLLGERWGWGLLSRGSGSRNGSLYWFLLQLLGATLLILYYFALPTRVEGAPLIRFVQLNIALHLLVACIPFIRYGGNNGLWQYNKLLLQRLLIGVIFSGTLFLGLSLALFAMDKLFGLPIDDMIYPRLWMMVVFLFNSWYFLGGVPRDLPALEKPAEYPKILKIFAQYILTTLVAIYLSILLAYMVKILITAEWPSGWIGFLVSGVAAAGLFSLVMLYPLAHRQENRWVGSYARLFYILMLPAVAMLLMAIYKRVDQYGITENRYYLVVLALWLVFTSIRGLLRREPTLKVLPISLCLLALICSCGPWGAFSVARTSQTDRLEKLLVANEMLVAGKMAPAPAEVSLEHGEQISAIFDYMSDYHGIESISHWFDDTLNQRFVALRDSLTSERSLQWEMRREIMTHLDLQHDGSRIALPGQILHFARGGGDDLTDITPYEFAHPIVMPQDSTLTFVIEGEQYRVRRSGRGTGLTILVADEERLNISLLPMLSALEEYATSHAFPDRLPGDLMNTTATGGGLQAMLMVFEIHQTSGDIKEPQGDRLEAMLLLNRLE